MEKSIWKNGIMGLVVGDALGLPAQFCEREQMEKNPITTMGGYGTFNMPPGTWSDDSSLALATMDSFVRNRKIDVNDIMNNFVKWLYEDVFTPYGQAFDIGLTCEYAIEKYRKEGNADTCGKTGEWANGNGGLMRIMPICLFAYEKEMSGTFTAKEVLSYVHQLTAVTHNHKRALIASGIYYFMVKAILEYSGSLKEILQTGVENALKYYGKDSDNHAELQHYKRLFDLNRFAVMEVNEIKSSGYVVDSLEAAVWCVLTTNNFKDCLLKAVNLGDDTDTVGAIAGGLAGLYYGYEMMPEDWLEVIVKREWIEEMCAELEKIRTLKLGF